MADVAARAGVSHQTVSRVLNSMPGVAGPTSDRVRQAIAELGYRRNIAARMLALSRSRTVGLLTWGTHQTGPQSIVLALEDAARSSEYRLTMVSLRKLTPDEVEYGINYLLEQHVEALVVIVPHLTVLNIVRDIDLGIPVIVVEGDLSQRPLTAAIDNTLGGRIATRHLLDLGHGSVTHLAGPPGWTEAQARIEGWRAALADAGVQAPPLRWGGDWSAASGYKAGRSIARDPEVTAVFAANDQMALGLIAALHEAGRSVPDDVSVVGFDDLPEAAYFHPRLTTVRQDFTELGRRIMTLVERVLDSESDPHVDLLAPELVLRSSTAVPTRA